MAERTKVIKTASWVAIGGNALLAMFMLVAGFISDSLSVLASGIDSAGDVLISVLTLLIAYLISRPPSIKFPYGYGKAEPNATIVLSFIIFFAGAQLLISSIKRLAELPDQESPERIALIVMIVAVVGKMALAWYQVYMGRKVNSRMLIANAKNMQGDVVISLSVLLGLVFTYAFHLPILDPLIALLVSVWVIWIAVRIFIETNMELMDGNIEKSVYEQVFQIVEKHSEVRNPHRMRIRRAGHRLMINIDIELDGDMTLKRAHEISHQVEKNIRDNLSYEVFDVILHVEPYGDHIREEDLGISKKELETRNK